MATAHPQIRVGSARRERARHGIETMSVRCSRPETGAAEFDRARGWLGLPRALGAYVQPFRCPLRSSAMVPLNASPFL